MRTDLDQVMRDENIDAIWVSGSLSNNPDMVYFTGIQHVNNADLFKIQGKDPVLYHFVDMEREEAAKSGLETHAYFSRRPLSEYIKESSGDLPLAVALRMKEAMANIGLTKGTIALSGQIDLGYKYAILEKLKGILPEIHFSGFLKDSPLEKVRMTKTSDEIDHVRKMGTITTEVIGRVQKFLQSKSVKNNQLVFKDGSRVRVKDVKRKINLWLAELGADNPEETIFAIGRDGGIPHSAGTPDDIIALGKPIVFDIFPCEAGGGYFYDCTRTWCLGFAPDHVMELYQTVLSVHHQIIDELKPNTPFKAYQALTCKLFAEKGHVTVAENATTQQGYLHSLGHGVGLNVHEKPFSGSTAAPDDVLIPGVVFTVEPGLYYPDRDMGVRIEDTICLNKDGNFEKLADFPYDFVIPMS